MLAVFGENLREYSYRVKEVISLFSGSIGTSFTQSSDKFRQYLGSSLTVFMQCSMA
jgi:hypothetical protein